MDRASTLRADRRPAPAHLLARPPLRCSVGVMAFDEAQNIGQLLEALRRQQGGGFRIDEIVVVASGCTDDTEDVVREQCRHDRRIRLLKQERREGKASAVNLFLSVARGDVFVLESADTLPAHDAFASLLAPFADPRVGMTGARTRPVDPRNTLMGYASHFLWSMHHTLALRRPKLGELVAFRASIRRIPPDTAVDEASIESAVVDAGYQIRYAPDAIVFNKGPDNLHDYLVQRRRIVAGHKHLARRQGYSVASAQVRLVLRSFARKLWVHLRLAARLAARHEYLELWRFVRRRFSWSLLVLAAVCLEMLGYTLGAYDYHVRRRNPFVWEVARSTKRLKVTA